MVPRPYQRSRKLYHHVEGWKGICSELSETVFCPQEVFEARYAKIPQDGGLSPPPSPDKGRGETGTASSSSDSDSSSEAESSSGEVATQLASLKERVGRARSLWLTCFSRILSRSLSCLVPSAEGCESSAEQTQAGAHQEAKEKQVERVRREGC